MDWLGAVAAVLLLCAVVILASAARVIPPKADDDTLEKRKAREALRTRWGRHWVLATAGFSIAGAIVFVAAVADQDEKGIYGTTTAAWVQAIGSIGAILGAAGIAGWQAYAQRVAMRRAERKGRLDRVTSMGSAAVHLAQRLDRIATDLSDSPQAAANLMTALHRELAVTSSRINSLFDVGLGSSVVSTWIAAEAQISTLQLALEIGRSEVAGGRWDDVAKEGVKDAMGKTKSGMIALASACLGGPMFKTALGGEPV